ncbi:MAG: alkaline phosphatase family protein, partial [Fulvivirga sp.]|nr:alkaline phosphatase family protein [Fulvivirga sp.]
MRRFLLFIILFTACLKINAQKPKLVVGIVVDQMRQEYIYRFQDKFGEKGFKKLIKEGFMYKNAHYNYVPTYTAPGHSSIYTGATPAVHGIIGNDWYDKTVKREIYCAGDESVATVGSASDDGKMSPRRLLTTTVGD